MRKSTGFIANIDICKEYDARYAADEVHYETFAGLAAFFGRDMQVHWHDCFFSAFHGDRQDRAAARRSALFSAGAAVHPHAAVGAACVLHRTGQRWPRADGAPEG